MANPSALQYLRKIQLIVYSTNPDLSQNGVDLSNLRIKFSVKKTDSNSPNSADIRVYNVSDTLALALLTGLSPDQNGGIEKTRGQVILQAGYDSNFGVIFQGNIKQIILGRESATDTFVDIIAGDGDNAYTFAIMNTTIESGVNQKGQLDAVVGETKPFGVDLGYVQEFSSSKLPRGKVMYGNANKYLRSISQNTNQTWSIQDGKITFVPVTSYIPGTEVVLTSKTGLIGTPQQTNVGVNIKSLLNPFIRIGGIININEDSVQQLKIDFSTPGSAANIPAPLTQDGIYYVMVVEHTGDTRGIDWYTSSVCFYTDASAPPYNSVQVGIGL